MGLSLVFHLGTSFRGERVSVWGDGFPLVLKTESFFGLGGFFVLDLNSDHNSYL